MKNFIFELYQLFFDFSMHIPIAIWRRLVCKLLFKSFGSGSQVSRHIHVISPHKIEVGKNCFINRNVTLDGRNGLIIRDSVDIGEYSSVWTLEHDPNNNSHKTKGGETIIDDHVWIAPHCLILPKVHIMRGCVIGTGAVLTKSTNEEKSIYAGIPACKIGQRQNDLDYKLSYRIIF